MVNWIVHSDKGEMLNITYQSGKKNCKHYMQNCIDEMESISTWHALSRIISGRGRHRFAFVFMISDMVYSD